MPGPYTAKRREESRRGTQECVRHSTGLTPPKR
jgi:hypothetical protein